MSREDIFNGAKTALVFDYGWFNTIAEELGMDRALALQAKTHETIGAAQGKMMKEQAEQAGVKEFDAKTILSLFWKAIEEGFGMPMEVAEESPQRVVFEVGRCAVYEAGLMLGMDGEALETLCRAGAIRYCDTVAKQMNPKATYRLKEFRPGPDGCCVEEIEIG